VILGASGAGKTSLLNSIAGEVTSGELSGHIYVNGNEANGSIVKKCSGFVQQDDVVLDTMTVEEAIIMSARLRLPRELSDSEKMQKAQETIDVLGIRKCAKSIIGSATAKGISGGERKRVCMAMELVTDPSVLFLDEPTSGLDTFTAFSVVKLLKDLAASGRTVIATLHQPSSEIFHLIDDLVIMAEGKCMYMGPPEDSIEYFAAHGYRCPKFSNPADYYFMSILNQSSNAEGEKFTAEERISKLLEAWAESPQQKEIEKSLLMTKNSNLPAKKATVSSFYQQLTILSERAFKNQIRNPLMIKAKTGQTIILSVMVGLVFLNIPGRDFPSQTQDRLGALFFISVNQIMASAMGVLNTFFGEKMVFKREFGASYYSLPAYFLSKTVVDIPSLLVFPFLFIAIFYFLAGLRHDAGRFLTLCAINILQGAAGSAIGTLCSCLFDDLNIALAVTPVTLIPLMIFGGFFANTANIPVWLAWIKWLSPMKYGFSASAQNEFEGVVICNRDNADECKTGEKILSDFGLTNQGNIFVNIIILFASIIILTGLSYLALLRLTKAAKKIDVISSKTLKKNANNTSAQAN